MKIRVMTGLAFALLLAALAAAAEEAKTSSTVSGKVSSSDVDSFSPRITVIQDSGKETTVYLDRQTATVTLGGKAAQLGDLKAGQRVTVSGCKETPQGLKGSSVSVEAAAAASTAAPAAAAATSGTSSSGTASKSAPRVLRSDTKPATPATTEKK